MKNLLVGAVALVFLGAAVTASQAGGIQVIHPATGQWVPYTPPAKPPIGGAAHEPRTNLTTTVIFHPERPVGGGMVERAHREIVLSSPDRSILKAYDKLQALGGEQMIHQDIIWQTNIVKAGGHLHGAPAPSPLPGRMDGDR